MYISYMIKKIKKTCDLFWSLFLIILNIINRWVFFKIQIHLQKSVHFQKILNQIEVGTLPSHSDIHVHDLTFNAWII